MIVTDQASEIKLLGWFIGDCEGMAKMMKRLTRGEFLNHPTRGIALGLLASVLALSIGGPLGSTPQAMATSYRGVQQVTKKPASKPSGVAGMALSPQGITTPSSTPATSPSISTWEAEPFTLSATNPTVTSNPVGLSFPGLRGPNQLIRYDAGYGQPNTGTNEFGYEVTVVGDRVVATEGANSTIPTKSNVPKNQGYVLSGHGEAKTWLFKYAPIGAKITLKSGQVNSWVDQETYRFQVQQLQEKLVKQGVRIGPEGLKKQVAQFLSQAPKLSLSQAQSQAERLKQQLEPMLWASYRSFPQTAVRGIWHRPSESSPEAIGQSLDRLKASGINTIFLETYLHGDPIFPSTTFEQYGLNQEPPFPWRGPEANPDRLGLWIDAAHQRGMKVHVWFQTFYAGNTVFKNSPGVILTKYPAWANRQRWSVANSALTGSNVETGHFFLDPANPQVQTFLLTLIDEIVTRYPVDGFQLDYIRYPSSLPVEHPDYVSTTWGYSDLARQRFTAVTGQDPLALDPLNTPQLWQEWQRYKTNQVTAFVQKAHDQIKAKRPGLVVSASVFTDPSMAAALKHQDWPMWAKQGWVDALAPMTLTSSTKTVAEVTQRFAKVTALPVWTGIFGPFNNNTATHVVEQVGVAEGAGAKGVILFDTAHFTPAMSGALKVGLFKTAASNATPSQLKGPASSDTPPQSD